MLSKYQLLEDKICILDFGGNSIQRGRKTSEENKDILQDFPHEWVYNISSDIQNTRQNWIKSCSISGVKASAYTLPNMGPYPECKPGPYPSHSIASGTWWILQPWCSTIHDEVWRVTMTHSSCKSLELYLHEFLILVGSSACFKQCLSTMRGYQLGINCLNVLKASFSSSFLGGCSSLRDFCIKTRIFPPVWGHERTRFVLPQYKWKQAALE